MGVVASQLGCGGCFAGLGRGGPRHMPDTVPTGPPVKVLKVSSMAEAMKLERTRSGSFFPSPPTTGRGDIAPDWASPTPYQRLISPAPADIDFDLFLNEIDSAHGTVACQLDVDAPGKATAESLAAKRSKYEVEQMLASPGLLPPPLSAEEREAVIRSILPTATFQMLSKIPRSLLTSSKPDSQLLRRKLASGATLVFVSAGLPSKRFTFERAAALGVKVVLIDHHDSWAATLVKEGIAAKFMPVDMSKSSDVVFEEALRLIQSLGEDGLTGPADGVATFVELSVPLVVRLAERLGLPGHKPAAVDAARDKHATRASLKAAGLPTPRNILIKDHSDLDAAVQHVGFPAVLKPASGAASLGVKKVENESQMRESYQEVIDELKTLVVSSGALIKGTSKDSGVDASNVISLAVLLEQYLDGSEVDVDVVMSGGEHRYAAVSDNGPTMEPYFNETWAVAPSLLPRDAQQQLRDLAVDSVKALGFSSGVFHVECKMTSTGPQLIEVNARMGGGQVFECNLRTWGVDLVEETIFASLGVPAAPPVPKQPLSAVAYCYVNAPVSGVVNDLSRLEEIAKRPGVVWAKPLVKPGAEVVGPERGLPTWLCDLFVARPSAKEALEFLQALEKEAPVAVER